VKRLSDQTLYEILEVDAAAPAPEISAAYERARSIYGPGSLATYTLMTPEEAALLTSRIEEAGRTLLDPEARARYDRSLTPPAEGELRAAVNAHAGPGGPHGTNGTNGSTAPFTLPPVIPALQPAEPRAEQRAEPSAEQHAEREAEAPAAATSPEPPPEPPAADLAPPAPPPPQPIRLDREIRPTAEPVAAAAPETPAVPATPEPAAAPEVPLPEGAQWTGEALRRVREARGLTVQQIADRTKVTRYHVENVEAERFAALPAPVYLRGILLSIARELRLDGQKVARAYLERCAAAIAKK
jgi:hypothetical protein